VLASAGQHACVVHGTKGVSVACWGDNADGQLGTGGLSFAPVPVEATELSGGLEPDGLAAGGTHTCAFRSNGQDASCFGANSAGQLGVPGASQTSADVRFLENARSLGAGGETTCAVLVDGSLYCWGANGHGQVGDGTLVDRDVPTLVSGH
jgi:alpha-tubulin suppressor-like RCC1 family protein